jgi:O-antigen ligase
MGAAVALLAGVAVAMAALVLSGHIGRVVSVSLQLIVAISLLVGLLYYVTSHNARYQAHFERIFLGRAESSSGGRFDLWRRGFDVFLEHGAFLWGVGPENFREVDGRGNQLHSDFIAFLVERGVVGTLGLFLIAGVALGRAANLVWMYNKHPARAGPEGFVFLGAIVAAVVESLTHQVFHFRELWLVLALQEAMVFTMTRSGHEVGPDSPSLSVERGIHV